MEISKKSRYLAQVRDLEATPDLYVLHYPEKRFTLSAYAHSIIYSRVMKKQRQKKDQKLKQEQEQEQGQSPEEVDLIPS